VEDVERQRSAKVLDVVMSVSRIRGIPFQSYVLYRTLNYLFLLLDFLVEQSLGPRFPKLWPFHQKRIVSCRNMAG
jgi:hypothetical protein